MRRKIIGLVSRVLMARLEHFAEHVGKTRELRLFVVRERMRERRPERLRFDLLKADNLGERIERAKRFGNAVHRPFGTRDASR